MHDGWKEMLDRLEEKRLSSTTWSSEQNSLKEIFLKANEWEIDPTDALCSELSNLRTIIKEAKQAILDDNPIRLAELFHMAANTPIKDIRLKLGATQPVHVPSYKVISTRGEQIGILLSLTQFERLKIDSKAHFHFDER